MRIPARTCCRSGPPRRNPPANTVCARSRWRVTWRSPIAGSATEVGATATEVAPLRPKSPDGGSPCDFGRTLPPAPPQPPRCSRRSPVRQRLRRFRQRATLTGTATKVGASATEVARWWLTLRLRSVAREAWVRGGGRGQRGGRRRAGDSGIHWVKEARADAGRGPPGVATSTEREELSRLRKELRQADDAGGTIRTSLLTATPSDSTPCAADVACASRTRPLRAEALPFLRGRPHSSGVSSRARSRCP